MRAWTFKRKIRAAAALAALLETAQNAKGEGDGKGEGGKGDDRQKRDKQHLELQKKGEGREQDGDAFQKPDPEENQPAEGDPGDGEAQDMDSWRQPIPQSLINQGKVRLLHRYHSNKWGSMTVKTLPFERKKTTKGSEAVPEGVLLRYPHRYVTDMALFKRSRGHLWGSVLVDNSGSMSLDINDLHEFLRLIPAANIAVYSAQGSQGLLTIVAEKGRVASDANILAIPPLENNGIDGPSLRWLAQQPKPRLWVSDGQVTGEDGQMTFDLLEEAARICKAHKILRVGSLERGLALVKSGRGGMHS